MSLLYPRITFKELRFVVVAALIGAVVAGVFGGLHDQVTFTISTEYFTKLKFMQFKCANFGLPDRLYVFEIGFLASWWVGLIVGWFIARLTVEEHAAGLP